MLSVVKIKIVAKIGFKFVVRISVKIIAKIGFKFVVIVAKIVKIAKIDSTVFTQMLGRYSLIDQRTSTRTAYVGVAMKL